MTNSSSKVSIDAAMLSVFAGLCLFNFHFYYFLILILAASKFFQEKKFSHKLDQIYLSIVFIFLLSLISTFINNGVSSLTTILLSFAVFNIYYFVYLNASSKSIRFSGFIFLALFLLLELKILWIWINNPEFSPMDIVSFTSSPILIVPNDIAYMVFLFPLMLIYKKHPDNQNYVMSTFIYFNYFIFILASIALESRLSLVICVLILLLPIMSKIRNKYWIQLITLGFVFVIAMMVTSIFFDKSLAVFGTRLTLWAAAIEGIIKSPLIGQGIDSFGYYYDQFRLVRSGSETSLLAIDQRYIPWPHNLLLELVFSFGVLTILPIIILAWKCLMNGRLVLRLSSPIALPMITFLIIAISEVTYLRPPTIVIVAVLCALTQNKNLRLKDGVDNVSSFQHE